MPIIVTTTEVITVNTIPMQTYGWGFESLPDFSRTIRGEDEQIPGGGERSRPKFLAPMRSNWALWVSMLVPETKAPGGVAQCNANIATLRTLFEGSGATVAPTLAIVRTHTAVGGGLVAVSATGYANPFTVTRIAAGVAALVTVTIIIPAGTFA